MNKTVVTVLKAVAGVGVLAVLLFTVNNWLGDYRAGSAQRPATEASPAGGEGSATDAEGGAAAESGGTVIVLVDGLNVREEPASDAKSVVSLKKGDELVLVREDGKWYEVKTSDGKTGWVSSSPSYTRIEQN